MNVVDHEPQGWFLVQDGQRLLLDVNCSHTVFGYSWLIQLNQHEIEMYSAEGRHYISKLSSQIQASNPIAKGTHSPFKNRRVEKGLEALVDQALVRWKLDPSED